MFDELISFMISKSEDEIYAMLPKNREGSLSAYIGLSNKLISPASFSESDGMIC
jgi:hypothetical protein